MFRCKRWAEIADFRLELDKRSKELFTVVLLAESNASFQRNPCTF